MLQLCKNATALTVIFTVNANFLLKYVQEKIVIKNQNLINIFTELQQLY